MNGDIIIKMCKSVVMLCCLWLLIVVGVIRWSSKAWKSAAESPWRFPWRLAGLFAGLKTVVISCGRMRVKESSEISQLQQENAQLRQSLDDHQSAIELIMSRYRSRVSRLVAANRRQRAQYEAPVDHSQVVHPLPSTPLQCSRERVQLMKKRKKSCFFGFWKNVKERLHSFRGHLIILVFNTQLPKVSTGESPTSKRDYIWPSWCHRLLLQ